MTEKTATIEVAARELTQLFNSLDPSPFHERDLDDEAEAYIVSWAKELWPCERFRIRIHLPGNEIVKAERQGLPRSLSHYFGYRSEMLERSERECLRRGRRFLLVGILVLTLCSMTAHALLAITKSSPIAQLAADGLVIFGWVANWRPAEIFLYELWEIRRKRRLYSQLAAAEVVLVVRKEGVPNTNTKGQPLPSTAANTMPYLAIDERNTRSERL